MYDKISCYFRGRPPKIKIFRLDSSTFSFIFTMESHASPNPPLPARWTSFVEIPLHTRLFIFQLSFKRIRQFSFMKIKNFSRKT